MLFNSYIFIFIFLPLCVALFYMLTRFQNGMWAKVWLIAMSLWFYGYFNRYYLSIMVLSILVNYGLTLWINRKNAENTRKIVLALGIIVNLGVLFYFKYFDFFISNINACFKVDIPLKNILLPLGISFFTFQQIGFLVDVYKREIEDIDFVDYSLFVSFFPQLIAGPIVSGSEMLPQFKTVGGRRGNSEQIARGLTLFILGLSKKVLIADTLGKAVDTGYAALPYMNGLDSFLIMIWYALQLYFDFSGYCDMARGIANILGFELPVNFNSPYKAENIVEFWKRWHLTLTRFFTRYVYIPLGGNRVGIARMYVNILIVYFLSGLWHGAGWNYILWGMMHGILYVITRACKKETKNDSKITHVIKCTLTFIYVSFAWVYFRAADIAQGTELVRNIFTKSWRGVSYSLSEALKMEELWYIVKIFHIDRWYGFAQNLVMAVITIFALVVVFVAPNAAEVSEKIKPKVSYAIMLAILGMWCVVSLSQVSTFLYFNF